MDEPPPLPLSRPGPAPDLLWQRLGQLHDCAGLAWQRSDDGLHWSPAGLRLLGARRPAPRTMEELLARLLPESARDLRHALARTAAGDEAEHLVDLVLQEGGMRLRAHFRLPEDPADTLVIALQAEPATSAPGQDALVDSLTGLANRRGLKVQGEQAVLAARRHGRPLALLFIDLDRFKQVNDSLGHAAGDELLRSVARRLRACVRGSDVVARQGGDEFVVVLAQVQRPQDAALVAQKILDALQEPVLVAAQAVRIECSIGVALLGEACPALPSLLRAADTAMYAAKQAGRNTVRFYNDALSQRARRRADLGASLGQALARDELFLVYQPCLRLADAQLASVEVLLRWRGSDGVVRVPADFLPLAEENGEIVPIGAWVLAQACRQARAWAEAGLAVGRLVVNLSAAQLRDEGLPDVVAAACRDSGWPATALELELCDSALAQDRDAARRALAALQAAGVSVCLDDFGSGLSNLLYLHRYRIGGLKLHRQFALGAEDDASLQTATAGLIGLARALGLRVAAKGVESPAVAAFLQAHGCDEAQGFHYARPMPGPDLELWCQARALAQRAASR